MKKSNKLSKHTKKDKLFENCHALIISNANPIEI